MNPLTKVKRLERFHLARAIFWVVMSVVVVLLFFFASHFWQAISVLYLVLVSHYANAATDLGNWQAAEAERRSIEEDG